MARNLNMAVFAALVAALAISSVSAVTHQVGDNLGWLVPPGGAVAYSTWASNNTFKSGDVLVFTFASGQHDVAKVTKEAFDSCNATSPISLMTNSPANVTLTSGEHYFICTFDSHCSHGQKLAVNVTESGTTSSPSPSPSKSPTPASSPAPVLAPEPSSSASPPAPSSPAPSPSAGPTTYTVGDVAGWNVIIGNDTYYKIWASNKTFYVGDILVFNFVNQSQDVATVTKTNYESCNNSNTLSLYTNPPVQITLNQTGDMYFICTLDNHCTQGQHLAITVKARTATPTSSPAPSPGGSAPAPSTTATPPSAGATPPSTGATPPGSSTTPTTPSPSIPPSDNGATSIAGLSGIFMSVAVALFMF